MVEKYSVHIMWLSLERNLLLEEAVSSLLYTGLAIYRHTETPGRVQRQFPRYLASTSPHHRILKSYRRAVDVDSIASSVTSDWDKEVGNQENKHNPN